MEGRVGSQDGVRFGAALAELAELASEVDGERGELEAGVP